MPIARGVEDDSCHTSDAADNLRGDGSTSSSYDALNRQITTGGITNSYNADGVLVQQGTTRYTQDLIAPLSQILSDGTQTHVYGHERLYSQTGTVKIWYATDALGSVRYTMNAAGVASTPITYDPWGGVASGSVPTFGFTGEMQQGGLVHLRARWYSTSEGRFGSRDPFAGMPEMPYSLNAYQYAYAAPTLYTDPSGQIVPISCPPGYTYDRQRQLCVRGPQLPSWLPEVTDPTDIPLAIGGLGTMARGAGNVIKPLARTAVATCVVYLTYLAGRYIYQNAGSGEQTIDSQSDPDTSVVMEASPRPHLKYPNSELPVNGKHPYQAPKQKGDPDVVKNPRGKGLIDRDGNIWEWAKEQHGGPHWDVQHPRGGHTNVYPDGEVHQGKDNF